MSWKYSPEIGGEPAGWSAEGLKSSRQALEVGRARYEGAVVWTAWVMELPYAAQMPTARSLLVDAKESAAERGGDVSSFDSLTDGDIGVLQDMLNKTVTNWEKWLAEGPNSQGKKSTVVIVENRMRHEPPKAFASGDMA